MDELIVLNNGSAELSVETAKLIADFERKVKEIQEKEKELKEKILAEMEMRGLVKLETDDLILSYIAPTTRETLDSKALKEELPTIYDEYAKLSSVKASLRIKLK